MAPRKKLVLYTLIRIFFNMASFHLVSRHVFFGFVQDVQFGEFSYGFLYVCSLGNENGKDSLSYGLK